MMDIGDAIDDLIESWEEKLHTDAFSTKEERDEIEEDYSGYDMQRDAKDYETLNI